MGIAGINSALSSAGSQYDFKNMTNAELLSAAQTLGSEGKITVGDEMELMNIATGGHSYPIDGNPPSVADVLKDPTQKDFLSTLEDYSASNHYFGSTKGAAIDDSILQDLAPYQIDSPSGSSTLHAARSHDPKINPGSSAGNNSLNDLAQSSLAETLKDSAVQHLTQYQADSRSEESKTFSSLA